MVTLVGRVPLEEINSKARAAKFGRTVQTIIAGVLYGLGWVSHKVLGGTLYGIGWSAAKAFGVTWTVLAWMALAVKVGWVEARSGGARGPS
jgi:hypothetical protein